jgi:hypothetical protein
MLTIGKLTSSKPCKEGIARSMAAGMTKSGSSTDKCFNAPMAEDMASIPWLSASGVCSEFSAYLVE